MIWRDFVTTITLLVVSTALLFAAWFGVEGLNGSKRSVPRCTEDEVLRGTGDFEDGRWTDYVCIHRDRVSGSR